MTKLLTPRQSQVLHFLVEYQEEHGGSPTMQEIREHFGFRSVSSVQGHLDLIEKKGFLTKTPRSSRSIRVVDREARVKTSETVAVPLIGKIAAGSPAFALEEAEEVLSLPKRLFRGRDLFALRVEGDSMIAAGIFDGDIAVLRSQSDFIDGDIAVVVVDEEATLKRVFRTPKGLRLHAENDAYPDRLISRRQVNVSCRVAGILIGTIRKFD